MVDVLPYLEGLAYVGFIAGAIFAVLELRGISRDRKTSIVQDMFSRFGYDVISAYSKVANGSFKNAQDMEQKCSYESLVQLASYFEGVGYLVRRGLVDKKIVAECLPTVSIWRKMEPWAIWDREKTDPTMWAEFEYLALASEDIEAKYLCEMRPRLEALRIRKKGRAA